jgi:GH24 family phage-related lysozyme (muramidase)
MNEIDLLIKAKAMLLEDEGKREFPYDDKTGKRVTTLPSGGNLTIGIGRNLSSRPLSEDEIDCLFLTDFIICVKTLRRIFPNFNTYSESRQLGLINMLFNMGEGNAFRGFLSFKNTIRAIRNNQWNEAVTLASQSNWARHLPHRAAKVLKMLRGT